MTTKQAVLDDLLLMSKLKAGLAFVGVRQDGRTEVYVGLNGEAIVTFRCFLAGFMREFEAGNQRAVNLSSWAFDRTDPYSLAKVKTKLFEQIVQSSNVVTGRDWNEWVTMLDAEYEQALLSVVDVEGDPVEVPQPDPGLLKRLAEWFRYLLWR